MRQNKNTLTNAEWIMMEALWGKEPQILSEIIESIGDRVDWNYQTYASYLKILHKKGFIHAIEMTNQQTSKNQVFSHSLSFHIMAYLTSGTRGRIRAKKLCCQYRSSCCPSDGIVG